MKAKLPRKQKKANKKVKCIVFPYFGEPKIVLKDGVRHTKETIRLCNAIKMYFKRQRDEVTRVWFESLKKMVENRDDRTFIMPHDL